LLTNNLPSHSHPLNCVGAGGNQASPVGAYPAIESTGTSLDYSTATSTVQMNSNAIGLQGGGQPFSIQPPTLCLNYIIALEGIFPSQN
jgi:microcystin-dependent protein